MVSARQDKGPSKGAQRLCTGRWLSLTCKGSTRLESRLQNKIGEIQTRKLAKARAHSRRLCAGRWLRLAYKGCTSWNPMCPTKYEKYTGKLVLPVKKGQARAHSGRLCAKRRLSLTRRGCTSSTRLPQVVTVLDRLPQVLPCLSLTSSQYRANNTPLPVHGAPLL